MEELKIPRELKELAPFFHDINLGKGLNTTPETYRNRFAENFFSHLYINYKLFAGSLMGLRALDLGCSCGGFRS